MMNLIGKLGGRKFLVALLGVIAVAANSLTGIDQQTILIGGGIAISYILGQSFADGLSGGATSSTANVERKDE